MKTSQTLSLETVITHAPGVFRAELDGTLLLAAQYGGQGHCLDPVGLVIWEALVEPCSIASLCDLLSERYEVEKTVCENDVLTFISELLDKKMVMIVLSNS
ncbi:MAG: PqqD family protein [Candidatus Riflebacteria bacterium]|nr:PqqD family protein [Candidatus Riflebacteria bacterium]